MSSLPTSLHPYVLPLPLREIPRQSIQNCILRDLQGLSAAKDAVRMARIAKFYERLPKGSAPERKSSGLLGRYQDKYFGKEPSAAREYQFIYLLSEWCADMASQSNLACHLQLDGPWLRNGILLPSS